MAFHAIIGAILKKIWNQSECRALSNVWRKQGLSGREREGGGTLSTRGHRWRKSADFIKLPHLFLEQCSKTTLQTKISWLLWHVGTVPIPLCLPSYIRPHYYWDKKPHLSDASILGSSSHNIRGSWLREMACCHRISWVGEERMKINNKNRKKKEKSKRKKTEKQLSNLGCPHQVSLLHLNCTSQYHKTILCRIHQYSVPEQKATGNGSTASGTVTKVNRKKDVGTVSKKHAEVHAKQLQRTVWKPWVSQGKKQEHVDRGNRARGAHHCMEALQSLISQTEVSSFS